MKRLPVIIALLCVLLPSCGRKGRIIPQEDMAAIFADMFLADQWISLHNEAKRMADTSLFYEPIFNRHGYSFDDYDASVNHYLLEASDLEKILKRTTKILDLEYKRLSSIKEASDQAKAFNDSIGGYAGTCFDSVKLSLDLFEVNHYFRTDSIAFRDSLSRDTLDIALSKTDSLKFVDKTKFLENVKRRYGVRADSLQKVRKLSGRKFTAIERKSM